MTCRRLRLAAVVVGVASSLGVGCATTTAPPRPAVSAACDFPERDLTRVWAERRYWCVPEGVYLAHHTGERTPYRDHDTGPAAPRDAALTGVGPDFFGPRP